MSQHHDLARAWTGVHARKSRRSYSNHANSRVSDHITVHGGTCLTSPALFGVCFTALHMPLASEQRRKHYREASRQANHIHDTS